MKVVINFANPIELTFMSTRGMSLTGNVDYH